MEDGTRPSLGHLCVPRAHRSPPPLGKLVGMISWAQFLSARVAGGPAGWTLVPFSEATCSSEQRPGLWKLMGHGMAQKGAFGVSSASPQGIGSHTEPRGSRAWEGDRGQRPQSPPPT